MVSNYLLKYCYEAEVFWVCKFRVAETDEVARQIGTRINLLIDVLL